MAKFFGAAITSNFGTKNLGSMTPAFMGSIVAAASLVEQEIVRLSPRVSGMMISKCKRHDAVFGPGFAKIKIGWDKADFSSRGLYFYPPAVDLGTGKGRRGGSYIYPKDKENGFLRFYSKKNSMWISVRRIAGQEAQHILTKTIVNTFPKIRRLCNNNVVMAIYGKTLLGAL